MLGNCLQLDLNFKDNKRHKKQRNVAKSCRKCWKSFLADFHYQKILKIWISRGMFSAFPTVLSDVRWQKIPFLKEKIPLLYGYGEFLYGNPFFDKCLIWIFHFYKLLDFCFCFWLWNLWIISIQWPRPNWMDYWIS